MGTSASYKAPVSPQWTQHKRRLTTLVSSDPGSPTTASSAVSGFIGANGGAHAISSGTAAIGGQVPHRAAQRLGGFLAAIASQGVGLVFQHAGLPSVQGKTTAEVIAALEDHFCESSNTLDDVDVRNAMARLCNERWADQSVDALVQDLEDVAQQQTFGGLLECFFGYVIYEQVLRINHERLLARAGEGNTRAFEVELLRYIQECIRDVQRTTGLAGVDWDGDQGAAVIAQIYEETLDVFGEA